MKQQEFDAGIYRIQLTVYKTGNVHMRFINRMTGEERVLKVKNPLIRYSRDGSVNYRV